MQDRLVLGMDYHPEFTDFRIQVLDDNPFPADVPAVGWTEFSKLAEPYGIWDVTIS